MKDILKKSYDKSSETYDEKFYDQQSLKFEKLFYINNKLMLPDMPLLDMGCGTGFLQDFFGDPYNMTGVDFSFNMLVKAKKRGVRTIQADIEKLPFKNNIFHSVIAITVLMLNTNNSFTI